MTVARTSPIDPARDAPPTAPGAMLTADEADAAILQDLVDRRRLSAADAENLLALRAQQGQRLGRLLVTAGVMSQESLRDALAHRLGLDTFDPPQDLDELDSAPAALLPPEFLRFNAVLPVGATDDSLTIAMAWPPDDALVESVRQATGRDVTVLAATQRQVEAALDRVLAEIEGQSDDSSDVSVLDAEALRDLASEAPVIQFLTAAIERAVSLGASDIHLERGDRSTRLRVRVDGELVDIDPPPIAIYAGLVSRIKIMARLDVGERRLPQDGRVQLQTSGRQIDVRVSILPSMHGEDVVLRILDRGSVQLDLDELGLGRTQREHFRRMMRRPEGMILLTGPTGSGKTTTLYSGLREIARPNVKIVTVEDPVEYHLDGVNQIQVRPEIGLDFARCLRSILRHDPDIIMVGEIRDKETAGMAVQSALTGHLVISTLHTNSAAGAFPRLLDMGVEDYLIASAVVGVMAQRLVRRLCPDCVEPYEPEPAMRERFNLPADARFHRGRGCRSCFQSGYRGRTVVAELLAVDEGVQRAILDNAGAADIHRVARQSGMRTLWEHGVEKVCLGETSLEQVVENIQE